MNDSSRPPTSAASRSTVTPEVRAKGRRTLLLLAFVAVAPVIASYSAYYLFPREQKTNYGLLLAVPAPPLPGTRTDGQPFALAQLHGRWVVLFGAPASCEATCQQTLYATRQARLIQGREMERVQRVWLITDTTAPDPALLAQHPDLLVVQVSPDTVAGLPGGPTRVYLIDPIGNLVLAFPSDLDIKKAAKDIERLLRASRIG